MKVKNLEEVKSMLPDIVEYKGKTFTKQFYSMTIYPTEEYPKRSEEIIWDSEDGSEIYLFRDSIEYFPAPQKPEKETIFFKGAKLKLKYADFWNVKKDNY